MGFIGVQPASVPLTASDITNDIINADKIADDSISEEHIDNTAITGFSALTSLADTDKFLVSDASDSNNLKYVEKQYLGGGTHVQVAHSRSTSQVNNITFDNIFTSSYSIYYITGFMQGTANGGMYYYLRDASGGALYSDGYNGVVGGFRVNSSSDGSFSTGNFGSTTGAQISMNGDDSSTTSPIAFETIVYDPRLTSTSRAHLSTRSTLYGSDNYFYSQLAASRYKNNTVATGIYLYYASGSIKYHDVTIYGISGTGV